MNLSLSLADAHEKPFQYALYNSIFSARAHAALLDWLEASEAWALAETEFYEQYEFCVGDAYLPDTVKFLVERTICKELNHAMRSIFQVQFSDNVNVVAHKLVTGQHIGIHNDVIEGGETHRLTIQLNRGLHDEDGGYFMLFNSSDPSDVHRILRPVTNSAIAFAISEHSNHAVSRQKNGIRYTLLFCFNAK